MTWKIYWMLASASLGASALAMFWKRVSLFVRGNRTTGRLKSWKTIGNRRPFFHPVVTFIALDGEEYELTGQTGYSWTSTQTEFSVLYPALGPEKAIIYSFTQYWLLPCSLLIMAVASAFAASKS